MQPNEKREIPEQHIAQRIANPDLPNSLQDSFEVSRDSCCCAGEKSDCRPVNIEGNGTETRNVDKRERELYRREL